MLTLQQIEQQYPAPLRPYKKNLLREYLQFKILEIIFASEFAPKLSFLGGTALRIVHDNTRFSEDLDFDNFGLNEDEFGALAQKVRLGLEAQGMAVEISLAGKEAYRCRIRLPNVLFANDLSPHEGEKILIQIDSLTHGFEYRPESRILNRFDVFSKIFVTPTDILLSRKIWAIANRPRAKGRDFFDIVFLLSFAKPNYPYLNLKIGVSDSKSLRLKIGEIIKDLDFDGLARDVQPFLFNAQDAQKVKLFPTFITQAKLD
ncbi:nucleotidyl transferase AbiEii/AbiGii toxin family protein [Candidatus Uhrbacteria bacterium]|nr:nucleotidyl transferase AbiEii/AbiGii toxin family protein [Candidatus Uhrbacteria bacterium]